MYYDWHDINFQRRLKTQEELRKIIREKINSRINQIAAPVYSCEETDSTPFRIIFPKRILHISPKYQSNIQNIEFLVC